MAKTAFATSDAQVKKLWEEKLYRDAKKASYFDRFMGEGEDAICQTNTLLTKSKGDQIYFNIVMRLTGSGVTSGMQLEGNEEALTAYSFSVTLEEYAHAVRDRGPLDRQKAVFSIDDVSKSRLQDWGSEKIDQNIFDAAFDSPTKIFYKTSSGVTSTGTAATAKTALRAADSKLTPAMISTLKAWAVTGGNRSYIPMRPVRVEGRSYYVLLVHPDCMYDLKVDSTFTQAMREAEVRGPSNPLFQGATAIWDGVVVHEHENCPVASDGGAGAETWAKGLFMGAQALVYAKGGNSPVRDEEFDYGRQHGFGWGIMCKAGKPKFNSKDYACQAVYLCRTNISGL